MTSEQVMLSLAAGLLWLAGCVGGLDEQALRSPYTQRQVWAVAPLANESGSLQADGAILADHLARQLENAQAIDVLPVNRVLAAMEALGMPVVASADDAAALRRLLEADGLIVGTITAYDPYDPPKLGLAIELYTGPSSDGWTSSAPDVRPLSRAATDVWSQPTENAAGDTPGGAPGDAPGGGQPVSVVSGFFDASDPAVRQQLQRYAEARAPQTLHDKKEHWRLYRISMDLYTEFVSYVVSSQLLQAETQRLAPPPPTPVPAS